MSSISHNKSATALQIDIVSDVVCPWCIIGYGHLRQALDEFKNRFEISLNWHPFELNPQMPAQGQNLREHLAKKYGTTPEQSAAARERLTAMGEAFGFQFNYYDEMKMVNTFSAHQLLLWANEFNQQTQLKLALFSAFFSEKLDVSDHQVLTDKAVQVGLDKSTAQKILAQQTYANKVRTEQAYWMNQGISAVPAFIFNQKYLLSGGQPVATFTQQLSILDN